MRPYFFSYPSRLLRWQGRSDVDLKKAAKLFANKFATGASVSKNPQGEDEIFIQGDVADEVSPLSFASAFPSLGTIVRSDASATNKRN